MTNRNALSPLLACSLAGLLLSGCEPASDYGSLELVSVTGKVTLDGNPLAGVLVRFDGPDASGSEALTDETGSYRLMYDSTQPGCTPGKKTVRITQTNADVEGADPDAPSSGEGAAPAETIPAAYNAQSKLTADVSQGNQTFDFDLKSLP
ncbi:MAG: carboxypeptidase-like regulatory domain-containing protein [Pirellulaceae bacterium]